MSSAETHSSHRPNLHGQAEPRATTMAESYANPESQKDSNGHGTTTDGSMSMGDRDLAGLLQAVTSAVGQESGQHPSNTDHTARRRTRGDHAEGVNTAVSKSNGDTNGYTGLHEVAHQAESGDLQASSPKSTRKRKRASNFEATPMMYEGQHINGAGVSLQEQNSQLALSEARAAGVHSAAALFRRPSASSKKYTRPPMSKLFTSLELSPENFLHLQAAAKSYMLDPHHPERRACVGNRGKGDTDMVKLRLYNCVKDFLELEGHGEKFFGESVANEGGEGRRLMWPSEKNLIISATTPLLRRMVTNERQRQYAIETRKAPASAPSSAQKLNHFETEETPEFHDDQVHYDNQGPSPYHGSTNIFEANPQSFPNQQSITANTPTAKRQKAVPNHTPEGHDESVQTLTPPDEPSQAPYIVHTRSSSNANDSDIDLQVEILGPSSLPRGSKQTHQSIGTSSAAYTSFESFSAAMIEASHQLIPHDIKESGIESSAHEHESAQKKPRIECHLETGLVEIENDNEYQSALETVRNTIWMGRNLKVILRW